jgi:predicted phage terminase large subunit-like protein
LLPLDNDVSFETLRPYFDDNQNKDAQANRLHAAKRSFAWFMRLYMSHYLTMQTPPFHKELYELATEERLLVVMPRSFGKSVIWSICYPLWVILNNPYNLDMKWKKEDLILISNTSSLSEKWVRYHVRELLENARIQKDYAPSAGKIWRSDEIEINVNGKPHGRIYTRGAGAQIRGEHPTELILDDLENREEAASEGPREKMREYFYQDLWGTLRDEEGSHTRVKIVGTFVHPLALLPELYEKDWWVKRKYGVYKPDGTPLWSEYMDEAKINQKRSEITETAFHSEYLNEPIVSENPTFYREWFKRYEPGMIRSYDGKKLAVRDLRIVTAIDPAISQRDGADYTAVVTYGVDLTPDNPRIYCLEFKRGHWSMSRQINEMLATWEKFPGSIQVFETVAYQQALYLEYKERLDREHLDIKVIEVKPDKDKGRRANAITPLFQKGWVHFDHNDKMQQILMNEFALFDYTKRRHGRDDGVDASLYCLDLADSWIRRAKKGRKKQEGLQLNWSPINKQVYCGT